ncbi:hypothetical protein, partial [Staphylococcus aureus]
MILRITLLTALMLPPWVQAQQAADQLPAPLAEPVARALLEQDPSVAAARASLEAARRTANILEASPYEWNARATG